MPGLAINDAGGSSSMKQRLAAWRAENNRIEDAPLPVPEDDLLRDAILLLQGVDGKHVAFIDSTISRSIKGKGKLPMHPLDVDPDQDARQEGRLAFTESPGKFIAGPVKDLFHRLSELGWLYRCIRRGINSKFQDPNAGMIELALSHAMQDHLREYDELISELETRRSFAPDSNIRKDGVIASTSESSPFDFQASGCGLTLHRLFVWTDAFVLKMRMMGILTEACTVTRGGALLSLLHSYTTHGDPFISKFTSSLLETVSAPFFDSLASWIYYGELEDPSHEFFVERGSAVGAGTELSAINDGTKETWSSKYHFRKEMLPSFIPEDFGRKIFSTGRSLNYIRFACGDASWVTSQRRKITDQQVGGSSRLQYNDIPGLEQTIAIAYSTASRRLFEIFFDKFGLLRHMKAIKDYLLLGRGDFVELLMENLGPSLGRPANTLLRHNLTSNLENSIRGSSSNDDHPDVLHRLDARMLDFEHGEIGWDVFTLEYKIDPPVDVVLDENSMHIYTKLFTHLWKIKRCEHTLNDAWRKVTNGSRWWKKVEEVQADFHHARLALSEMMHFTRQLQHFCHLEVIDCSWTILERFALKKEGDLDGLIAAHQQYVKQLATKALLRGDGHKADDGTLRQVREAFNLILQFKESLDALCNYALAEASRLDSEHDDARGLVPSSRAGTPLPPMPPKDPEQLAALRRRLTRYSALFHETVVSITTTLAGHSDLDLRALSIRINFSLFYLVGRKDRK